MDVLRRLLRPQQPSTAALSDRVRELATEAYGGLHFDTEDEYGEAIAGLTEVLRSEPTNAVAHNNRGLAYAEIGMVKLAAADLGRAIRLDDTNPLLRKNRAALSSSMGDVDAAIADLSKAIDLDPSDIGAYVARAEAYRSSGRDAESLADTKRAEELRTTDPRWIEFERLRLAAQRSKAPDPHVTFTDAD